MCCPHGYLGDQGDAAMDQKHGQNRARGMARGLTLLTIQRDGEFRLGVKTGKGVLDVIEAARFLQMHAPATVDDLLQNEDGPSLNALVDAALQSNHSEKAFLDETSLSYGPVVTRPEKIVCVGLNYRRHATEVNLPIPQQPALLSNFNTSRSPPNHDAKRPADDA